MKLSSLVKSQKAFKVALVLLLSVFALGCYADQVHAEYTSTTPGGGNTDDDSVTTGLCSGRYIGKLCYNSYDQQSSGWKWVFVPFNGRTRVTYSDIHAIDNKGAVKGVSGNSVVDVPGCVEAGAEGFYVLGTFWYELGKNSSGQWIAKRHTPYNIVGPFIWGTVWGSWTDSGPANGESLIDTTWAGGEKTVSWPEVKTAYDMGLSAGAPMSGPFENGAYSVVCAWQTAGGVQSNTHAWIGENNSLADAKWTDGQTGEDAVYTINLGKVTNDQCNSTKSDTRQDKEVTVHLASYLRAQNATAEHPARTNFRIVHTISGGGATVTGANWQPAYGPKDMTLTDKNEHHLPHEIGYNGEFKVKIPKNTPSGTSVRICERIDYKKHEKSTDYDGETHACATIKVVSEEETIPPCEDFEICKEINNIEMGQPNYGNTAADVYVKNYSSTQSMREMIQTGNRLDKEGFLDTWIFAKPGDSIQFRHRLCSPAQEVSGTSLWEDKYDDDGTGKWGGSNSYSFGLTSGRRPSAVNYKFALQASPNRYYSFGNYANRWTNDGPPPTWWSVNSGPVSGAQYTPLSPQSPVYVLPQKDRNSIGFRIFSPSVDATSKYKCSPFYTLSRDSWKSPGYQIPGFSSWPSISGSCGAVNNTDGATNKVGAGRTISQKIYWNNIVGFVQLRGRNIIHEYCRPGSCHSDSGEDLRWSESWDRFTNTKDDPKNYLDYDEVKGAAGSWGWDRAGCSWTSCSYCCCPTKTNPGALCHFSYVRGNSDPWYRPAYWYDYTASKGRQYEKDEATIYTPYNFTTDKTISITNNPVIYGGSSVSMNWKYEVLPKNNPFTATFEHATITPNHSRMQVVEFLLSPNATGVAAGDDNNDDSADVCDYYQSRGAGQCEVVQEDSGPFNPTGDYEGWKRSGSRIRTVPDNVEVGSKYCVAIGVYPADSTNRDPITPDSDGIALLKGLGMLGGNTWNISNAVCRTIAKKPSFQVWNGGLFTPSRIISSISKKEPGAALGHDYDEDSTKIFGSWSEQLIVAAGDIWGMSSGAGLGYNGYSGIGGKYEYNFALNGGVGPNTLHSQASTLTISNTVEPEGSSGITSLSNTILTRLKMRYMNLSGSSVNTTGGINGDGLKYRRYSGSYHLGQTEKQAIATIPGRDYDNTLVIQVDGTLYIDGNICYGTCETGPTTHEFSMSVDGSGSRLSNYSLRASSISALPQILIFADSVMIHSSVTRIDAWLVVDEGTVNTCYDGDAATSRVCQNPLVINGPVFAQSLLLRRTAGSWTGSGTHESGGVENQNIANDGSITPGEVFNLRSDVYLWAYNQAQRYTEAVVTYTRELAPRY